MRQIVLDTETTGLEPSQGHRIIEIGCVELVNRKLTGNHYHQYINPEREVDEGAVEVHGITNDYLADKPVFRDIVKDFLEFIGHDELIIHNAPFDVGFIDHELRLLHADADSVAETCRIIDTLLLARKKHPGQKNNLDALCKRYNVDNSQRDLHGALLDAEILADVYLLMTGGQTRLIFGQGDGASQDDDDATDVVVRLPPNRPRTPVIRADAAEIEAHLAKLNTLEKVSGGRCLWLSHAGKDLSE